ncbi:hypothetical protein [Streptomyces sp. NPDC097619]
MTPNTLSALASGPSALPGPLWIHLLLLAIALGVFVKSLTGNRN